jgi:hypothetical protein
VFARDKGCVAVLLGEWLSNCSGPYEIDHVQDENGIGKRRAPSDLAHLVTLCRGHHRDSRKGSIWANAHRPALRAYLASVQ